MDLQSPATPVTPKIQTSAVKSLPKLIQSKSVINVQLILKLIMIGITLYLLFKYMYNAFKKYFGNFVTVPVVEYESRRLESLVRTERQDRERLITDLRTELDNFREELDDFRELIEDDTSNDVNINNDNATSNDNASNNNGATTSE